MARHIEINHACLRSTIKQKEIAFGGNRSLEIYGTLHRSSARRMKREYKKWKNEFI